MEKEKEVFNQEKTNNVGISGYIALFLGIMYFSGLLTNVNIFKAFDFTNICGVFGKIVTDAADTGIKFASNFRGSGGSGARDGFMFALTMIPPLMMALGSVQVIEDYGGLRACQKLLTPVLKPILGIPGICGLAIITGLQTADGGAAMTRQLREGGYLTYKETLIFTALQFSGGAILVNYFSSGAAMFPMLTELGVSISVPFAIILIFKVIGANAIRLYVKAFIKE